MRSALAGIPVGGTGISVPVRSLRHGNLEPCTFARNTVLGDRDAGDTKDLAGEEHPEPRMFEISPVEDRLFLVRRNTNAIVLTDDHKPATGFL